MEASTSPYCEMAPPMIPQWLSNLLAAPYFNPCPQHAALHRSERNFFCIDCCGSSLCSICVQREHSGHSILQIRKSSYHDAVRVSDVGKLLDLVGIQVYVINSAKIVFLNGRPQARPMKGAPYHCETCQRTLLDACRFCSISCKLAALPADSSLSITPGLAAGRRTAGEGSMAMSDDESAEHGHRHSPASLKCLKPLSPKPRTPPRLPLLLEEQEDASSGDSLDGEGRGKRRRLFDGEEVSSAFPPLVDAWQPGTPPLNAPVWRTHKRKGVPHRSPLA